MKFSAGYQIKMQMK